MTWSKRPSEQLYWKEKLPNFWPAGKLDLTHSQATSPTRCHRTAPFLLLVSSGVEREHSACTFHSSVWVRLTFLFAKDHVVITLPGTPAPFLRVRASQLSIGSHCPFALQTLAAEPSRPRALRRIDSTWHARCPSSSLSSCSSVKSAFSLRPSASTLA
jgi:hypothetical protein